MTAGTGHERPSSPVPAGPPAGFRLDGVVLLGDAADGSPPVDGLTLLFDSQGFVIVGPVPGAWRRVHWSAVVHVTVGMVVAGTDGGIATPLDVTSAGRTIRFVLPAGRVSQAEISLLTRRLFQWGGASGAGADVGLGTPPPAAWADPSPRPFPMGPIQPGWAVPPVDHLARDWPRRRRKVVGMSLSALLVLSGLGIWAGLAATGRSTGSAPPAPRPSPDQQLAQSTMLAQSDLPSGWQPSPGDSGGTSAADKRAERQIAAAFQKCMGITADQATTALGGQSRDQTAQAQSPVFVGPASGTATGAATELQSSAAVVRSHLDERNDFAVYSNPRFPQCNAVAGAAEAQIGLNDSSGAHDRPGPAEGHAVSIAPSPGEQVLEVESTFTLSSDGQAIAVQDYQIVVAGDRVEASLGAFAIGTAFPTDVLDASVSALEHRVASQGSGAGSA